CRPCMCCPIPLLPTVAWAVACACWATRMRCCFVVTRCMPCNRAACRWRRWKNAVMACACSCSTRTCKPEAWSARPGPPASITRRSWNCRSVTTRSIPGY
ncbi:tRNA 5-methylaminomethyl-2-thiouridine synthase subunit TusB, partial [Pseudomonas sp. FEN]